VHGRKRQSHVRTIVRTCERLTPLHKLTQCSSNTKSCEVISRLYKHEMTSLAILPNGLKRHNEAPQGPAGLLWERNFRWLRDYMPSTPVRIRYASWPRCSGLSMAWICWSDFATASRNRWALATRRSPAAIAFVASNVSPLVASAKSLSVRRSSTAACARSVFNSSRILASSAICLSSRLSL